jgi:hypothetical protein
VELNYTPEAQGGQWLQRLIDAFST